MAGSILQVVRGVDDSGGTATTIAATINGVTAGSTLYVVGGMYGSLTDTFSCSDGTSYTQAGSYADDTGNTYRSGAFYRENVSSGNYTVTVTTTGSAKSYRRIIIIEIGGVQTASFDVATQNGASFTTATDNITSGATSTTNANDIIIGAAINGSDAIPGTGTFAAGTNFTLYDTATNYRIMAVESRNVSSTASYAATFTNSVAEGRCVFMAAFKEAAGGGGFKAAWAINSNPPVM